MSLPQPATRSLPALTALRAFAALAVFVFHLAEHGVWLSDVALVDIGYVGVGFFFVLSGFVLAWTYVPGHPRNFWRRRAARVCPSHLVTLLVAALLPVVAVTADWSVALPNLLLVHAFWSDHDVVFGMNGVSWSLSCEAFFYALFPLAYAAAARNRAVRWALPAGLLAGLSVWLVNAPDLGQLFGHFPPARLGEFALGVALACEVRAGWRPRWVLLRWVGPLLALTVAVVAFAVQQPALANALLAVPFAGLIFAAALGDLRGVTGVLARRWLIYAGEVSFAFYLVHQLVLVNLQPHLAGPAPFQAGVILVVACLAAVALHHGVERPLQRVIASRRPDSRVPPRKELAPAAIP